MPTPDRAAVAGPYATIARTLALVALLAANVFVAVLALRDDRGYQFLLFVFWAETAVVCAFSLPKMLVVAVTRWARERPDGANAALTRLLLALLAVVVAAPVQFFACMLLFALVGVFDVAFRTHESGALLRLPKGKMMQGTAFAWSLAAVALSHGISFCANFLYRGEFRHASVAGMALQPLARLALLVVLLVAGAVIAGAQPAIAAATLFSVLLLALKVAADLLAFGAERRRLAPRS